MFFAFAISMCILFGSMGRIVMKRALERQSPLVCAFYFVFTQAALALPFFAWYYQDPSTLQHSITSGTLFGFSIFFYFLSFHGGEVSLLTPFRGLRGVIALIISLLWWHEALSLLEVAGVVVIGMGILFLQKGSQFKKMLSFLFHKEALYMMLSVVLGVISSGFDKLGATELGLYTHYLITCIASSFVLLVLVLVQYRTKALREIRTNLDHHVFLVGILFSVAYVFHLFALQIERVTIVNGLLPIGTLLTTFFAGRYLQETVKEKWSGTVMIVLGAILIALA